MHGIVCVERLGVTRTIRVGVPKTPAEADAPVCALPSTVRVHAIIRTRSQCPILREVSKNEEIVRSRGPILREVLKRLKKLALVVRYRERCGYHRAVSGNRERDPLEVLRSVLPVVSSKPDIAFCDR
jgi:hypothetical protein